MTIRILGMILILGCWSCSDQSSKESEQNAQQTEITQQSAQQSTNKIVVATYESAAAYAARTDYAFTTANDEFILIEGNTYDEKPVIELPDNMLETGDDIEGPPGANPELVGKTFNLYYDADEVIYKIELVE